LHNLPKVDIYLPVVVLQLVFRNDHAAAFMDMATNAGWSLGGANCAAEMLRLAPRMVDVVRLENVAD
jgi:hypothetical protein